MDELRVVRREDRALIVSNEAGEEFRLVVDESVLAELRQLAKPASTGPRVNPRQIQSLIRAGKSRAEIIELTGAEESDIERYEEPVLAERRFILSSAQSVPVRTTPSQESEQQFGTVIAERLVGLNASDVEWSSWRDEEAGWMIGINFQSHDVAHRAVWTFEHRKGVLAPITPDAVTLSKQGDLGDRLIPKLRAVDDDERRGRFDAAAFDQEQEAQSEHVDEPAPSVTSLDTSDRHASDEDQRSPLSPGTEAALKAGHPSTGSIPIINADAEFERRREIDQRAIKSPEPEPTDLGQTADLLAALRRRRGERSEAALGTPSGAPESEPTDSLEAVFPSPVPLHRQPETTDAEPSDIPLLDLPDQPEPTESEAKPESGRRGKGRTSIPSWDDILFGTRGEGDDN